MSATQVFIEYQPLLQRIAFNMVGCIKDAEDLVQDTFEKWLQVDHQQIKNVKAYLIRMLKNACTNFLASFRKKRETSLNAPLQLLKDKYEEIDFSLFDFETNVSTGVTDLLQRLTLPEFSVFLLKEGFEFDYAELSLLFEKKLDHCRQLLSRAKKKKGKSRKGVAIGPERKKQLIKEIVKMYSHKQNNIKSLTTYLQKELSNHEIF